MNRFFNKIFLIFLLVNLSTLISYSQQVLLSTYAREYSQSLVYGNVKSIVTSEYSIKQKKKKIKKGKKDSIIKKYHFTENKLSKIDSYKLKNRKLILKNCIYYENGIFYKKDTHLKDSIRSTNSVLIYNDFGKIEKITCINESPCYRERKFTYEDGARLVYEEVFKLGITTKHIFYNYRKDKLINKTYFNNSDVEPYYYRGFCYNKEGLLHKDSSINLEKNKSDIVIYEYDKNLNISSQKMTGIINLNLDFKYEYDSQNNWINLIVFRNDIPLKYLERKIEYKTTENKAQNVHID